MPLNEQNAILFFQNASCSVCGPLYDKLMQLTSAYFPQLRVLKIDIAAHPEYRAKYNVFSSPLIVLILDGKEYFRFGGSISIHELKQKIGRLYSLKFDK